MLKRAHDPCGAPIRRAPMSGWNFLGDRVLAMLVVVGKSLLSPLSRRGRRRADPQGACPGALGSLRQGSGEGNRQGCADHLVLADPPPASRRRPQTQGGPIVGSACEAVIAALYLDGGGMPARAFHRALVGADVRRSAPTCADLPRRRLQEWAQSAWQAMPGVLAACPSIPADSPRAGGPGSRAAFLWSRSRWSRASSCRRPAKALEEARSGTGGGGGKLLARMQKATNDRSPRACRIRLPPFSARPMPANPRWSMRWSARR